MAKLVQPPPSLPLCPLPPSLSGPLLVRITPLFSCLASTARYRSPAHPAPYAISARHRIPDNGS
eukprot:374659-Rhodomonas_salina.1